MGFTKTYKDGSTPVVAVIGAGFSGLSAAMRLRADLNLSTFEVFEMEADIGGTWWSNTYPGCACDVPAHTYAFRFAPNYGWSTKYAPQPEIWAYMKRTAQAYGLYEKIRFRTRVTRVQWHEQKNKWFVNWLNLDTQETGQLVADVVFSGTGPLRIPYVPEQFDAFDGPKFHTSSWNHSVDLTGKRVAVVGSGASAIQIVPKIVDKVKKLEYYQRSATYVIPRINGKFGTVWKFMFTYVPFVHFLYYKLNYFQNEALLTLFSTSWACWPIRKLVGYAAAAFRRYQLQNKELSKKMTPNYEMGCRRVVVSSDYFPAVAKKNVDVHTENIVKVEGKKLFLKDGSVQEVDVLVLATGFQTQKMAEEGLIIGKGGRDLKDVFGINPSTYYGLTNPTLPNFFFMLGPNTTLGHNSVLFMIETQVDYGIKALSYMMKNNLQSVQVTEKACDEFTTELDHKMKGRVWTSNCKSWYQNEEGRVTALWWGTCSTYSWRLRKFEPEKFIATARNHIKMD